MANSSSYLCVKSKEYFCKKIDWLFDVKHISVNHWWIWDFWLTQVYFVYTPSTGWSMSLLLKHSTHLLIIFFPPFLSLCRTCTTVSWTFRGFYEKVILKSWIVLDYVINAYIFAFYCNSYIAITSHLSGGVLGQTILYCLFTFF